MVFDYGAVGGHASDSEPEDYDPGVLSAMSLTDDGFDELSFLVDL